jgi:hypothetical protein
MEVKPTMAWITIGKNEIRKAMRSFGRKPNQMTNSGAIAIFGMS